MNKSSHILNTSSNLLGFCLVVLTSLKVSKFSEMTMIDEWTGIACVFLMACSFFSFLSIRTKKEVLSFQYERIADVIFLIALLLIFAVTFLIAFTVIF
jgi:hypothetical protein